MQLPRSAWDVYTRQLDAQQRKAADLVLRSVKAYSALNPGYTVADMRDYCIEMMGQACQTYGTIGATLSASMFDEVMAAAGIDAGSADLYDEVDGDRVDSLVRYQAGRLVDGDVDGFAKQLAGAASDWVAKCANRTQIYNTPGRVRYARILTGRENCTFCTMLASRGFVYRTAKTAGAFDRWHRFCDCRVISGVDSIEGYDTDAIYDRWQAFEDIDARTHEDGAPWTKAEKDAAKADYAAQNPVWSDSN